MEPISVLATTIVAILVPYFHEAGKAFASKAGEAAWEKCEAIYQAIKTKFQSKASAQEALDDLKTTPEDEDSQAALRKELKKLLTTDSKFHDDLQKLVLEAKQIGIVVSGSGAVATSGGTAAGENGIAIGGNIEGGVHLGEK